MLQKFKMANTANLWPCVVCGKEQLPDDQAALINSAYYCYGLHGRICTPPSKCAKELKCKDPECTQVTWVCNIDGCTKLFQDEPGWECMRCHNKYYCYHFESPHSICYCSGNNGANQGCMKKVCNSCSKKYKNMSFCSDHANQEKDLIEHKRCRARDVWCGQKDCPCY